MEPKPDYFKLAITLKTFNEESDIPDLLNCVSARWKLLTYSSEKSAKKEWRFFRNSALITSYARDCFNTEGYRKALQRKGIRSSVKNLWSSVSIS